MAVDLAEVSAKLESDRPADRMLALAQLREVPDADAVPLIMKVIDDKHQQVRSWAVFALGVKKAESSLQVLLDIMETDPDYGVRADAAGALGYLGDIRAFEPLVRAFYEDVEWLVRFSAAVSLGNLGDARAFDVLIEALEAPETLVKQAAIAALGEVGDVRAVEPILNFVQSEDWLVRQRLAQALGNLPGDKSQSALEYLAKDSHDSVAAAALDSLRRLLKPDSSTPENESSEH